MWEFLSEVSKSRGGAAREAVAGVDARPTAVNSAVC